MAKEITILVERTEGTYVATARDEVGTLCSVSRENKTHAINMCRLRVGKLIDDEHYFEVQELTSEEEP